MLPLYLSYAFLLFVLIVKESGAINDNCTGTFSPNIDFTAQWSINGSVITFNILATHGIETPWTAIGFSESTVAPFMFKADVIISRPEIDSPNFLIEDRVNNERAAPELDSQSNIFNTFTEFIEGDLEMRFSRELVTGDTADDVSLNTPRYWIWAIGEYTESFVQHTNVNRGVSSAPIVLPALGQCGPVSMPSEPTIQPSSVVQATPSGPPIASPSPSQSPVQCQGSFDIVEPRPYTVSWKVVGDEVTFNISGAISGWMGVGFSDTANMPESDIVVGYLQSGEIPTVSDRYAAIRAEPVIDDSQDLTNTAVNIEDSSLPFMTFTRKLDTNDSVGDVSLSGVCRFVLWACCGSVNGDTLGGHSDRGVLGQACFPGPTDCPAGEQNIQPSNTVPTSTTIQPSPTPEENFEAPCDGSFTAGNSFSAFWTAYNDTIAFNISAATTGWVGIGFSEDMFMTNSDIILGGFDGAFPLISDRYVGDSRVVPAVDDDNITQTEDVETVTVFLDPIRKSARVDNGVTSVYFLRTLNPSSISQEGQDFALAGNCLYLLWAWGSTIAVSGTVSPHTSRGVHNETVCFPRPRDCPGQPPVLSESCVEGSIEVIDTTDSHSGRPLICVGGMYQPFCSTCLGNDEGTATVLCRILGLGTQGVQRLTFNFSGYPIYNIRRFCPSDSSSLLFCDGAPAFGLPAAEAGIQCSDPPLDCPSDQFLCLVENKCIPLSFRCDGNPDCSDNSDEFPINCASITRRCEGDSARLVGGADQYSGRVEVCFNGVYSSVCARNPRFEVASVVCRQAFGDEKTGYPILGGDHPSLRDDDLFSINDPFCTGSESTLTTCSFSRFGPGTCSSGNILVVQCIDRSNCQSGDIRLRNNTRRTNVTLYNDGSVEREGFVERCTSTGLWGRICNPLPSIPAWEVCEGAGFDREGGIPITDSVSSYHLYGPAPNPFVASVDAGGCQSVSSCLTTFTFANTLFACADLEGSGTAVMCLNRPSIGCVAGSTRFVYASSLYEGVVEICIGNTWRPVCYDNLEQLPVGNPVASVACRSIGLDGEFSSFTPYNDPANSPQGPAIFITPECVGDEANLLECDPILSEMLNNTIPAVNCTSSFALLKCDIISHIAVVPSPDLSNSLLSFDQGRIGTFACSTSETAQNFTIQNSTDILAFEPSGSSVQYEVLSAPSFYSGSHQCNAIISNQNQLLVNIFDVNTQATIGDSSSVVVRISVFNLQKFRIANSSSTSLEEYVEFVENALLTQFPIEADGAQSVVCEEAQNQVFDDFRGYQRFQCTVRTFPPQDGFLSVVEEQLSLPFPQATSVFISTESIVVAEIGFCDFEVTSTFSFDTYSWAESKIGTTSTQRCNFEQNGLFGNATRTCGSSGWASPDLSQCLDTQDIKPISCADGELRLRNIFDRDTSASGVLEVCHGRAFGTVCGDIWNVTNPQVACEQLGIPFEGASILKASNLSLNLNGAIVLDSVFCNGTEASITECLPTNYTFGSHDCSHDDDVILFCEEQSTCRDDQFYCPSDIQCIELDNVCDGCLDCLGAADEQDCPSREIECNEGEVKLMGGPDQFSGIVTVCFNGSLTTVCVNNADYRDATVLCRQAGFEDRAGSIVDNEFQFDYFRLPQGFGNLQCSGSEPNILNCSICPVQNPEGIGEPIFPPDEGEGFPPFPVVISSPFVDLNSTIPGSDCCVVDNSLILEDNKDLLAISCIVSPTCNEGEVRLNNGIVEVCVAGHYGYICYESNDDISSRRNFGINTCSQLGFDSSGAIPYFGVESFNEFGLAMVPAIVDSISCSSGTISSCVINNLDDRPADNCQRESSFGVMCRNLTTGNCQGEEIRLVTQSSDHEGILQMCVFGDWTTICNGQVPNNVAEVACTELGFQRQGAFSTSVGTSFPVPTDKFLLTSFECTGNERFLVECITNDPNVQNVCQGSSYTAVSCPVPPAVAITPSSDTNDGNYTFKVGGDASLSCVTNDQSSITITHVNSTGHARIIAEDMKATSLNVLERSNNVVASDEGKYICNATNVDIGLSAIVEIDVDILLPEGPTSTAVARFSVQNATRFSTLFPQVNGDLIPLIESSALEVLLVNSPSVHTINCSNVQNRPEDVERFFQRVECDIANYPPINDTLTFVQKLSHLAATPQAFCRTSFNFSENGFCDYDQTEGLLGTEYSWAESEAGVTATLPCPFISGRNASRLCSLITTEWDNPNTADCDALLELTPDNPDVFVELRRRIEITCSNQANIGQPLWIRTGDNFTQYVADEADLLVNYSRPVFNNSNILTFSDEVGVAILSTPFTGIVTADEGSYTCILVSNGTIVVERAVAVFVTVPDGPIVSTFMRFAARSQEELDDVFINALDAPPGLPTLSALVLDSISIEEDGVQLVTCINVPLLSEDVEQLFQQRIECNISSTQSPRPFSTFPNTAFESLKQSEIGSLIGLNVSISATGFCDREIQNDTILNLVYDWPETVAGQTAATQCFNGSETMATRLCNTDNRLFNDSNTIGCIDCGLLEPPDNGFLTLNTTSFQSVAMYSCLKGYDLIGDQTRNCTIDATWSGPEPFCQIVDCGSELSAPANGSIFINETTFGATIRYSCDEGFNLTGADQRLCQADGIWSGATPNCTIVDCGFVLAPTDGSVSIGETTFGATITYLCDEGFNLTGTNFRQCQSNGFWTGSTPNCTIVDCGPLSAPSNGSIIIAVTTFGSVSLFSCNEGYNISGSSERVCQASGQWSGTDTICTIVDCDPLPPVQNGSIVYTGFEFDDTAQYSCDNGYNLVLNSQNSSTRMCTHEGVWSDDAPSCQIVDCGPLSAPSNGSIIISETTFGSVSLFSCNEGYNISGSSERVCQASGQWSGTDTICTIFDCGGLSNPVNGSVEYTSTTFGSIAVFTCDIGYNLTGNDGMNTRQCLFGGWSGEDPYCQIVDCDPLPSVQNGSIVYTGFEFDDTAQYSCDNGYNLVLNNQNSSTRMCTHEGVWSDDAPSCQIVDCGPLSAPSNGSIIISETTFGSVSSFSCNKGYNISGSSERVCQASGQWSGTDTICTIFDCGGLSNPVNGSVEYTSTTFGSVAVFTCDIGYNLTGNEGMDTRQCLFGGWSGEDPYCQIVDCDPLPLVQNGSIVYTGFEFDDTAQYSCDNGYNLVLNNQNSSTRMCTHEGVWSDDAPSCQIVDCGPLSAPSNGSIIISETTFGSVSSFSCNEGYNISGSSERVCQASGQWSGTDTICTIFDCGGLSNPVNGSVEYTSATFGSIAVFTCDIGYNLTGNEGMDTRQCLFGGWSGEDPYCQIVDCVPLPLVQNGSIVYTGFEFDDTAQYSCDNGYNLVLNNQNSSTRMCTHEGIWSDDVPSCQIVDCGPLSAPSNGSIIISETTFGSVSSFSCNEGYNISGSSERVCQASGQWSGTDTICTIFDCGGLSNPVNGSVEYTSTTFGSVAVFTCDIGYNLTGNERMDTRQCLFGGWSGEDPYCQIVDCVPLPLVQNGSIVYTGFEFDDTAQYSCDNGYNLVLNNQNSSTRMCTHEGVWSDDAPFCQIVDCGPLSAPSNGSIIISETTFGSVSSFSCNEGYNISGSSERVCQASGQWSGTDTICTIFDCGGLSNPVNGSVEYTSTTFGSVAVFTCDIGYNLTGNEGMNTRQCLFGGWSGEDPYCQIVDCAPLPLVQNGSIVYTGFEFDDTAQYSCDNGYNLVLNNQNSSTRMCTHEGVWSDDAPFCQIVDCGPLSAPSNGSIIISETTFGSVSLFSCNEGYNISGSSERVCQASGQWSGTDTICTIFDCGGLSDPVNGSVEYTSTTFGSVAVFTCDIGYNLTGNEGMDTRQCLFGGWSGEDPLCQIVDCVPLPPVKNGSIVYTGFEFDDTAQYLCDNGYNLVLNNQNSSTRMCTHEGVWSDDAPSCQIVDCGPLSAPSNGSIIISETTFGSVCLFSCNEGYNISGSSERVCQASGQWSGTDTICTILDCGPLEDPFNGFAVYGQTVFGSTVTYSCDIGYNLTGNTTSRLCTVEGWSGMSPTCTLVDCGPLLVPVEGTVVVDSTVYQSTANYSCSPRYGLSTETALRTCGADGTWSGEDPVCSDICSGQRVADSFSIQWIINDNRVEFELLASGISASQFAGIGLSKTSSIPPINTDIITGANNGNSSFISDEYINEDSSLVLDSQEDLFDTSITREGDSLTLLFSRLITTTDNITDIPLIGDLFLYRGIGEVTSFIDRTHGAPSTLDVLLPVIGFPEEGLCPAVRCPALNGSVANWPSTIVGETVSMPCVAEVPDGVKVTRYCRDNGTWADEDITDCANAAPILQLDPIGGVYTVEVQRRFVLSCNVSEDGYPADRSLTWMKDGSEVPSLFESNPIIPSDGDPIAPTTVFQIPSLSQRNSIVGLFSTSISDADGGAYQCVGKGQFNTTILTAFINVLVPSGPAELVTIRVTISLNPFDRFGGLQRELLDLIPESDAGLQTVSCSTGDQCYSVLPEQSVRAECRLAQFNTTNNGLFIQTLETAFEEFSPDTFIILEPIVFDFTPIAVITIEDVTYSTNSSLTIDEGRQRLLSCGNTNTHNDSAVISGWFDGSCFIGGISCDSGGLITEPVTTSNSLGKRQANNDYSQDYELSPCETELFIDTTTDEFEFPSTFNCVSRGEFGESLIFLTVDILRAVGPGSSTIFIFEAVNNPTREGKRNADPILNSLEANVLNLLDEDLPGVQTVNCSVLRVFQVYTEYSCNITTVPPSQENIEAISEIVSTGLQEGQLGGFTINSNQSITFGIGGFCDPDSTNSTLYGTYRWPETGGNQVAVIECVFGAPFGIGTADANRTCLSGGIWAEPDFSACRDVLPEVVVSPSDTLTVEQGRSVSVNCDVTSVNGEDTVTWYKIIEGQSMPVTVFSDFINGALIHTDGNRLDLAPGVGLDSFRSLYVHEGAHDGTGIRLVLGSYINGTETITTSSDIAGTYVCEGTNKFGTKKAMLTIAIEELSADVSSSTSYIRVTFEDSHINVVNVDYQLAVFESRILEIIPVARASVQSISCINVKLRNIEMRSSSVLKRIECTITESPSLDSQTPPLEQTVIDMLEGSSFVLESYSNSSVTGFCDYEETSDSAFGTYHWPESTGDQFITSPCLTFGSLAKRTCLGFNQRWSPLIDFTKCRTIADLPMEFHYYLRFSSNFSNIISITNDEQAIETIRILIELTTDVVSECIMVPMRSIDNTERVECKVNGTHDPLIPETSPANTQALIISKLINSSYITPNTNDSQVNGFCDAETTEDVDRGTFKWAETGVGSTAIVSCPFGPSMAFGSRACDLRLNWSEPIIESCATFITIEYRTLNQTLDQISTENVETFVNNLTMLVQATVIIPDQSMDNAGVVSSILQRTVSLISQPAVAVEVKQAITINLVGVVDNFEEWPQENIADDSPIVVQSFENSTVILVSQENFTNLTVITENVALVAERIMVESLTMIGRTFSANRNNDGRLRISSVGGTTNQTAMGGSNLEDNQLATLTFPSGIDLRQLKRTINNVTENASTIDEDIGVVFVVYDQSLLFPLRNNQRMVDTDGDGVEENVITAVGSSVVSLTIAGLESGTILPEPITLNLRITVLNTENVTNATCVFFNFNIGDWDSTGCRTFYDPDVVKDEVTCQCTHLTNFACLVDISARTGDPVEFTEGQKITLAAVTYVGVTLSLVGLTVTIVTLLLFKVLRQRDVTKFHLQLCISLVCMYIVFVSGIDSTDNRGGCVTVGVMIHYFSLVAWMWMGAEALLMFQKLIIVFGQTTWKYLLLVSVVCWSVPLVPVIIPVSVSPDYYITEFNDTTDRTGFCYISHIGVFFGAFLGPILLVMIFNTVIYVLVIRVLVRHNLNKNKFKLDKSSMSALEAFKLLLSICGIMFLFGLSWIFAIFTFISSDRDTAFAIQFIFALFNALQGFWICLFFVILNSEARQAWRKLFCGEQKENPTSKSSLSSKKKKFGSKLSSKEYSSTVSNDSSTIKSSKGQGIGTLEYNVKRSDIKEKISHAKGSILGSKTTTIIEEEEPEPEPVKKTYEEFVKEEEAAEVDREREEKEEQRQSSFLQKIRVKRRSTKKQRKHEFEEVELDFFDDDEEPAIEITD